ncbi:MAG: hypothetical protein MUE94_09515 [Verrucomicrobia bacterium]|nr:hypothetical protein [Verrucomicrobiota bacterium]
MNSAEPFVRRIGGHDKHVIRLIAGCWQCVSHPCFPRVWPNQATPHGFDFSDPVLQGLRRNNARRSVHCDLEVAASRNESSGEQIDIHRLGCVRELVTLVYSRQRFGSLQLPHLDDDGVVRIWRETV